jgi:hypothetical protein
VFAAAFREHGRGQAGETLVDDAESACFYHSDKRAVVPCDACGRFLCSLCDLEVDGQHICPACFDRHRNQNGEAARTEGERTLHDRIAFSLALLAILLSPCLWWALPFLSIPVIVYGVRYWNAPRSVFSRGKWRMTTALGLAGLTVAVWCVFALNLGVQIWGSL